MGANEEQERFLICVRNCEQGMASPATTKAGWRDTRRTRCSGSCPESPISCPYSGERRQNKSDLEGAKIGDAGFHQVQVHFDEVVLYPGGFRGGEDFLPIESVLTHGHDLLGLRRPALDVHGKEAAGIFREIFGGVITLANGGDLELELDELGIEKFEQHVVGALAVHRRKLEVLVMKALLEAGLGGEFSHLVVFLGGALDVGQSRFFGVLQSGDGLLCDVDYVCVRQSE